MKKCMPEFLKKKLGSSRLVLSALNILIMMMTCMTLWAGSVSIALADPAVPAGSGTPPAAGAPQQPGGLMAFAPFILMFAVLYFLVLRPQQKKVKEQQT